MNLEAEYRKYAEELTGTAPVVTPVEDGIAGKLPLYLRNYYRLARTRLFGRRLLLALQNPDADTATPTEYAQHHGAMRANLGVDVVLVFPKIASYGRQQLVRQGIPFVVPHRQAFLPTIAVDLRERFPMSRRARPGGLTGAAQVVLLRHLLGKTTEGMALREQAAELGYSAMTLSMIRVELESMDLCATVRQGRSIHFSFPWSKRTLWERASQYLRNPIKARHWVRPGRAGKHHGLQAGLTALATLSMISDDELPACAMKASDYRTQLKKGALVACAGPEEAGECVECWNYDPRLLSDGPTVDRLSLYLSLREMDDERVAKALRSLLETHPW